MEYNFGACIFGKCTHVIFPRSPPLLKSYVRAMYSKIMKIALNTILKYSVKKKFIQIATMINTTTIR